MLLSDHRTKAIKFWSLVALPVMLTVATLAEHYFPKPETMPPPVTLPAPLIVFFSVATIGIWGAVLFSGWKIKTVRVYEDTLLIAGWREEITIPLHQVGEIDQPLPVGRLARIALHGDTPFGDTIWFLPIGEREGLFGPFRGVRELRTLVAGALGDVSVSPLPPADYARAWKGYWRLRMIGLLSPLLAFVAAVVFVVRQPEGQWWMFFWLALMLPWMITGNLLQRWPCPRCGQRFFGTWGLFVPKFFIRRCANCGLPKGAVESASSVTAGP